MKFEYDAKKSGTNADKHGIDFEHAQDLWQDAGLLTLPARSESELGFLRSGGSGIATTRQSSPNAPARCVSSVFGGRGWRRGICMNATNSENLERRFDAGESVLDYFETDVVLTVERLADLAKILNMSALSREAGISVQTLQAKIRRRTPLTGRETRQIVRALKRHHLVTSE
ncbi:MAG: hypothetical protein OXJ90_07820 [Spirochaetaceae bacterium]|nr:hypothetical protein [Spirochaetaceae bacterium]